jgi:hypothetical protein
VVGEENLSQLLRFLVQVKPNFDKRDCLKREKAYQREVPMRSDSFHRQNVQYSAGIPCKRSFARVFTPADQSSTVL